MVNRELPNDHVCNALCHDDIHGVIVYENYRDAPMATAWESARAVAGSHGWEVLDLRRVDEMPVLSQEEAIGRFWNPTIRHPMLLIIQPKEQDAAQ